VGRLEESKILECVLKENDTLFRLKFAFTKNPVRVYDETAIQLQITSIITLYIETIVVEFTESKLNTELIIQSELKALNEYSYETSICINPTTPSILKIKNIILNTKVIG
jgi:hypothetical protein